jgi:hypothetical protein
MYSTVLLLWRLFKIYINIIRKYRTIGVIGPLTLPISPFILGSAILYIKDPAGPASLKPAVGFAVQHLSLQIGKSFPNFSFPPQLEDLRGSAEVPVITVNGFSLS